MVIWEDLLTETNGLSTGLADVPSEITMFLMISREIIHKHSCLQAIFNHVPELGGYTSESFFFTVKIFRLPRSGWMGNTWSSARSWRGKMWSWAWRRLAIWEALFFCDLEKTAMSFLGGWCHDVHICVCIQRYDTYTHMCVCVCFVYPFV